VFLSLTLVTPLERPGGPADMCPEREETDCRMEVQKCSEKGEPRASLRVTRG
jgi:hypothetical protein